ncbi:MAG TPA: 50S ribosomal protein L10 [Candidatus Limnocylindrales bacterium]|nr:50S ribosomal protein L10 [Candidatus Limnocylindrales bacterium]
MPTEAKRATVAELKEEIAGTHAAIVADYRGLSVGELRVIRRSLREHGVSYRVVKNRLAKIAAQEAGREELVGLLDGPTGLAFGQTDEVTLAKAFLDAVRPFRTVTVRGGVIGDRRIEAGEVSRLAELPPREVLLAQLAGGVAAPLTGLASVISAPLRNLGYALSQVAAQKEANTPSA